MDGNPIAADDLFGCDHRFLLNRLGSTTPLLPDPITPVGGWSIVSKPAKPAWSTSTCS